MNPSTIVRYVSLSWLLLSSHTTSSFCPPSPSHKHRNPSSLFDYQDPNTSSSSQQLTLSQAEDAEEARLDLEASLARKRDAMQNRRLNEMFAEEDQERKRRQDEIDKMLMVDDEVWREERKRRMLGRFAGMEKSEVEKVIREEMEKEKAGEWCLYSIYLLVSLCIVFCLLEWRCAHPFVLYSTFSHTYPLRSTSFDIYIKLDTHIYHHTLTHRN
jgi:hypothetical protein